jgi:hypothetical protein
MKADVERTVKSMAKAHFDGQHVILDEPLDLAPGTPLIVAALTEETAEQRAEWSRQAAAGLARASTQREPIDGPRNDKPKRPLAVVVGVSYLLVMAALIQRAMNGSYAVALFVTLAGAAIVMVAFSALGVRAYRNQDRRMLFQFSTIFLASIPFAVYLAGIRVFVQRIPSREIDLAGMFVVMAIGLFWMYVSTVILLGLAEAIVAIGVGLQRWRRKLFLDR